MSEFQSVVSTTVFRPEPGSYASFRIPAAVNTGAAILAFCEGRRHSAADSGEIDIVLRRSADGGRSWGPLQVVATCPHATVGNPAPVVDPRTGTVALLSVHNPADLTERDILRSKLGRGRRVLAQRSGDGGETFSEPQDITAQTRPAHWGWYATGPGHGIALRSGRLVVPANHSVLPHPGGDNGQMYGAHCLLSDDGGVTWTVGFTDDNAGNRVNANESAAAELPDGRVYFNARNQGGIGRVDACSADGGRTLQQPYQPQPGLQTPVVQGSLLQLPGGPLLYSGPCHPACGPGCPFRSVLIRAVIGGSLISSTTIRPDIPIWCTAATGVSAFSTRPELTGRTRRSASTDSNAPPPETLEKSWMPADSAALCRRSPPR